MGQIKDFFEEHSYSITLLIMAIIFLCISYRFELHHHFYNLYKINYSDINTSFVSFFGVLFAFLFTLIAILFNLGKDSLFSKLIEDNVRNKNDVISYFSLGVILSLAVTLLSLFLMITYTNGIQINNPQLLDTVNKIAILNGSLVYVLFFLATLCLLNLILLLFTFLSLLRDG